MAIRLTSREGELLVHAAATFASPFAASSLSEWRRRCVDAIAPLLNTDRAGSILVLEGEPLHVQPSTLDDMAHAWGEYYYQYDTALLHTGEAVRRRVFHLSDLYDLEALRSSPFWTEWIVPYGAQNAFGMAISVAQSTVPVSFHAYPPSAAISARRGRSLLSLLHPAFASGAQAAARAIAAQRDALEVLETESEGILIADLDERMLHVSPRLAPLLGGRAAVATLADVIARVIRHAIGLVRPLGKAHASSSAIMARGITTQVAGLQVQAIVLHGYTGTGDPLIAAVVSRAARLADGDTALAARFGLTPRECAIAREISAGRSSQEIADRLGVTIHTVRRHTERVFKKLNVSTRAAVGPTLNGMFSS